jgi:Domain of unknown function (DUF4266)
MKNKKSIAVAVTIASVTVASLGSCTTVKEYQKNRINDAEMVLAPKKIQKTEISFQSYREGASGVNGGKTGGGCGCN